MDDKETKSYKLTLGINISELLELFISARCMIGPDVQYGSYTINNILQHLNIEINDDLELIVNYGLSLKEMIMNYSNGEKILDDYFDVLMKYETSKHTFIKEETRVRLFFLRQICSEDLISEMRVSGFRQANIQELLTFGIQHPEIQKLFCIYALGSRVDDSNCKDEYVVGLFKHKNIIISRHTKGYIPNGVMCTNPLNQEICFLGIKEE